MAMRSSGPTVLTLPPFRGVTRNIIVIAVVVFLAVFALGLNSGAAVATVFHYLALSGATLLRRPWQLVTYPFLPNDLLSTLFALLSIWTFGATLESERGSRWLTEYFLVATAGGGLLAVLVVYVAGFGIDPRTMVTGLWPAVLAIVLAYARFYPEQDILFIILTMKAKYLAAIYLLVYLALAGVGGNRFGAVTALCAALSGFLYLRFVPMRGLGYAASERFFGLRNAFYKAKRRRAAKKFTVYMKKQGKDVSLDPSGRYVDPDGNPRDPNDKRWMN